MAIWQIFTMITSPRCAIRIQFACIFLCINRNEIHNNNNDGGRSGSRAVNMRSKFYWRDTDRLYCRRHCITFEPALLVLQRIQRQIPPNGVSWNWGTDPCGASKRQFSISLALCFFFFRGQVHQSRWVEHKKKFKTNSMNPKNSPRSPNEPPFDGTLALQHITHTASRTYNFLHHFIFYDNFFFRSAFVTYNFHKLNCTQSRNTSTIRTPFSVLHYYYFIYAYLPCLHMKMDNCYVVCSPFARPSNDLHCPVQHKNAYCVRPPRQRSKTKLKKNRVRGLGEHNSNELRFIS